RRRGFRSRPGGRGRRLAAAAAAVAQFAQRLVDLADLLRLTAVWRHRHTSGFPVDLEIDLLTEDGHLLRRLNADPHLLAHDREHRDLYFVPDHDALVGLSRQNQHSGCTFLFADWPPRREPHPPSLAS